MTHDEDEDDFDQLWPMIPRFASLPAEFHSLEKDGPFEQCLICETSLSNPGCEYLIERAFRGTEPIVEYAMCMECQQGMTTELSEESLENIRTFFSKIDYQPRLNRLRDCLDSDDISPWLDECLVTGKKRSECRAYQIISHCKGRRLQLSVAPFMLSQEAIEQIMKVMSKATRDRLDDFMGDQFGMPPEFCESPDFFPLPI